MGRWCAVVLACGVALAAAVPAGADVDARLRQRLDPATAAAVGQVIDSARDAGIPTAPLIATALRGASKGAPGERIVVAVRRHASALDASRRTLGIQSSVAEIEAGAGAIMSGVPGDSLAHLRALRPRGTLVVPLVVMADLVTRRVPIATATAAVTLASRAGAADADFLRLRARVEADIGRGVPPADAAMAGVRGLGIRESAPSGTGVTDPSGMKRRIGR